MIGVLVTQGVLSTLVLCTGWNGHFAMEMTHLPSAAHAEAGSCVDVPVLAAAEHFLRTDCQWSPALDDFPSPLMPVSSPISSKTDASFRYFWHTTLAVPSSNLPSLRTVMLLI
jgi:hypothetical protein